jgi:hypothetical protein
VRWTPIETAGAVFLRCSPARCCAAAFENARRSVQQLLLPGVDLVRVNPVIAPERLPDRGRRADAAARSERQTALGTPQQRLSEKCQASRFFVNRDMTQRLVAPLLAFGGTPSMCVIVSNREKPMDTTSSSFTARNSAKRAAEKMIANGKALAVDYGIRPRDDGRFEIVWKTVPTTGEVETEIATAATAAEDGHYRTNPRLLGPRGSSGLATAATQALSPTGLQPLRRGGTYEPAFLGRRQFQRRTGQREEA